MKSGNAESPLGSEQGVQRGAARSQGGDLLTVVPLAMPSVSLPLWIRGGELLANLYLKAAYIKESSLIGKLNT